MSKGRERDRQSRKLLTIENKRMVTRGRWEEWVKEGMGIKDYTYHDGKKKVLEQDLS